MALLQVFATRRQVSQVGSTEPKGPLPACDARVAEPLEASIAPSVKWVNNNGFPRAVVRKRVPDTYGELVLQTYTDDDDDSDDDDDDDDKIMELVEILFCRGGGKLRTKTGSDGLKVAQGIPSRVGIPGKVSRANSCAPSYWTAVPKLCAKAPRGASEGPQNFHEMLEIVKGIKARLDISGASQRLRARGHSQLQLQSTPHSSG